MKTFKQFIEEEFHVQLSHDPNDFGAFVSGNENEESIIDLPMDSITSGFEPPEKMNNQDNKKHIDSMVDHLSKGGTLPPVLVRQHETGGYQILDGHHRWTAHKQNKSHSIRAIIIPKDRISSDMEKI